MYKNIDSSYDLEYIDMMCTPFNFELLGLERPVLNIANIPFTFFGCSFYLLTNPFAVNVCVFIQEHGWFDPQTVVCCFILYILTYWQGVSVRVRRPTDYNPSLAAALGPSQPSPHLNLAAVGLTPG